MTISENVASLLSENALAEALEVGRDGVKTNPSDKTARHIYIDLLILAGDYERADSQCNLATTFAPEDAMGFAMLRNQLRAMEARRAWFETGAVPAFPEGPSELDQAALALGVAHRAGEDAMPALEALEEARGERPMIWNGAPVPDLRDLDDRTPHALEVLMSGGGYLWVDFAKIASVALEPIARPRDLAFRRAELELVTGSTAPVLLPAIYHGTAGDPRLQLGRETEWITEKSGITTGRGQRCFLAGDQLVSFHDARAFGPVETVELATNA